jgi:hypothetical protein
MNTEIHFHSCGSSGNIFAILGIVSNAMRSQRRICDYNTMRDRVFAAKSYHAALSIIREYVDLIDDDGRF